MNRMIERTNKALITSRRRFLENLGKCGLSNAFLRASPLALALMGSRYAEAAGGKKFILIYHPNGKPENAYGGGGSVSMSSRPLLPFAPHVGNVAALEMNISQPGQHGNLWLAAGASSYNGSDVKANSVNVQASNILGNTTAFRSIQLGVFSGDNAGTEPTSGSQPAGIDRLMGQPLSREWNSHRAIASIFRDTPAAPSTGTSGTTGPSIFQRRLSAYDANMKALATLEAKLGQDEKNKLASHKAAVARLQARAQTQQTEFLASQNTGGGGGGGGSCGAPSVAAVGTSALQEYKAQVDVAVAALKCGLTNVCSIQFSETQASWKPNDGTADAVTGLNAGQDHHNGGNHGNPATLPDILAYMNKGVAHLIAQLKKEDLFKDTVVCVISEMGEGVNHLASNGPITVASGINGFRAGAKRVGKEHSEVFTDVFKLLGLESSIASGAVGNYGTGGIVI